MGIFGTLDFIILEEIIWELKRLLISYIVVQLNLKSFCLWLALSLRNLFMVRLNLTEILKKLSILDQLLGFLELLSIVFMVGLNMKNLNLIMFIQYLD